MPSFFFLFFWGFALVALTGGRSTGISSSVAGGVEREDSESDMFAVVGVVVVVESRREEERPRQMMNDARL